MVTGSGATDLTRTPESAGEDVVKATISIIHEACIFDNDYLFLRRLAYVTSDNGLDPGTYREGFHGGIFQVRFIGREWSDLGSLFFIINGQFFFCLADVTLATPWSVIVSLFLHPPFDVCDFCLWSLWSLHNATEVGEIYRLVSLVPEVEGMTS